MFGFVGVESQLDLAEHFGRLVAQLSDLLVADEKRNLVFVFGPEGMNDLDCPSLPGSCRKDDSIACGSDGVFADTLRVKNRTISGNNGFQAGVDIATERKPRLETTSCGVSGRLSKMDALIGTWGVCSGN